MNRQTIQENKLFKTILAETKKACDGKEISDIIDDNGFQYVDLVMEGGGMLGIALVGFTTVLEGAGVRFLGIGGASAGSINALLLAALGTPEEAKGEKLLTELASKNFFDFVDGDGDARDLIETWVKGAGKVKLAFKAAQVIDTLNGHLGLNPGDVFLEWVENLLNKEGIRTLKELRTRMETLPKGLRTRNGLSLDTPEAAGIRLCLIAADVATETKVEFPKMAPLYWKNPDRVNPALFVRASMSIPYFFYPFRVKDIPQGQAASDNWKTHAGYIAEEEGKLPAEALFIDGGIMSNFPIDIFHTHGKVPEAPTFGVKLELDHRLKKIEGPFELMGAIFNSARHTLDYDFIRRNPDYRRLVSWIPAKNFNWLDFNMSNDTKEALFLEGAKKAKEFLCAFDWADYKALRGRMAVRKRSYRRKPSPE